MYSRKTSWNRPLHGDFNARSTKEKENAPREKKTILNEEHFGNYRKTCRRTGRKWRLLQYDFWSRRHPSWNRPLIVAWRKKGKLYSFLHWQRKTRLNLFSSVMQLLIHSWKEQPFTKPSWSMNESEKIRRAILPKTVVKWIGNERRPLNWICGRRRRKTHLNAS